MSGFKGSFALASALCLASLVSATPALTTIQDVIYKADGTKFNGVVQIAWTSFQAADSSNIAMQNVTVAVTNGYLRVSLVPTTNASPAAVYNVVYNGDGDVQFTEQWVVPPSAGPLRVADVRSTVTSGAASALAQIQISDVSGLQTELNIRPTIGTGFAPARSAIIDGSGGIAAASGNLSDCIHVDGSSGPCGSGTVVSGSASFSDAETPSGVVDGSNATFQLANGPTPAASLVLFRNGLALQTGFDFTLSGSAIAFQPTSVPQPGDVLQAFYRSVSSTQQSASSPSSATPSCTLYSVGNIGSNWVTTVNGTTVTLGPAIQSSNVQDVPLFTLPARGTITGVREKTTLAWSGANITTFTLSVGDSVGGGSFYTAPGYDLTAPAANTNFRGTALFKGATDAGSTVVAHLTSNVTLSAVSISGAVDIDVCWVTLP